MTQKVRGLPPGYSSGVSRVPELDQPPVELGDYLDEQQTSSDDVQSTIQPPPKQRRSRVAREKSIKIAGRIPATDQTAPLKPSLASVGVGDSQQGFPTDESQSKFLSQSAPDPRPPRKQINMKAPTVEMLGDLLQSIRNFTPQPDATMSELIHALVLTAHDARQSLDLKNVPPRGKWGSPTAKLFVDSLKNAFQEAIAHHQRNKR